MVLFSFCFLKEKTLSFFGFLLRALKRKIPVHSIFCILAYVRYCGQIRPFHDHAIKPTNKKYIVDLRWHSVIGKYNAPNLIDTMNIFSITNV